MKFIDVFQSAVQQNRLHKLTLAKVREKKSDLRNVFFRMIVMQNEIQWQAIYRYNTKDQTKNYSQKEVTGVVEELLANSFYNADLFFENENYALLQSKKGKQTLLHSNKQTPIILEKNDRAKSRLIPESAAFLKELGLSSSNNKIYAHAQDKYKQINKYAEHINALVKKDTIKSIVDMGSGKGYLTFGLYYILSATNNALQVKGVELREDLVEKCNAASESCSMKGLSFEKGSIDSYEMPETDMVIALHACDIATDMAIAKGLEAKAKYIVVAPCCHKQIRKAMTKTDSNISPILKYGIQKERQAEMITDTIRALLLESLGYQVKLFEFISSEHTGKNVMITAKYTGQKRSAALGEVDAIKDEFGIDHHYLEKLL